MYNIEYVTSLNSNENLQFLIDDDIFLETLHLRICAESIKFTSVCKKNIDVQEQGLKEEILEKTLLRQFQILKDKKQDLEKLREHKLRDHMVRSHLKWLNEGF